METSLIKPIQFLINASNQANVSSTSNVTAVQLNAFLVFIEPYELESLNLEGFDIEVNMEEDGKVRIDGLTFETIEVKPGVKVLGIFKPS